MLSALLRDFVNFILPPRRTQRLVDALTINDLHQLSVGGRLPYHADEAQALVWELKYYGNKRAAKLAGEFLSEELLGLAAEELGRPLLVPVPMHPARQAQRGHNQTELLCEAALKVLATEGSSEKIVWPDAGPLTAYRRPEDFFSELPSKAYEYAPQALQRIKNTPHQQGLERKKRLLNMQNSMQADKKLVSGRVCVVVDDVTTTGATLAEAARALKAAGARKVHCIALAQS